MKILKNILLVIIGIIVLALVAALFIKKDYAIERTITINKPKQEVFNYLKFVKNQDQYSVWNKIDPAMKKTYKGTDGTVGFIYAWDSANKNAGMGEQEITNITEGNRIDMQLRFKKPFEAKDNAYLITDSLDAAKTQVKWGFRGHMDYPFNLMCAVIDMEEMVGNDLQGGLNNLKAVLEK